jgi:hypothetical protein
VGHEWPKMLLHQEIVMISKKYAALALAATVILGPLALGIDSASSAPRDRGGWGNKGGGYGGGGGKGGGGAVVFRPDRLVIPSSTAAGNRGPIGSVRQKGHFGSGSAHPGAGRGCRAAWCSSTGAAAGKGGGFRGDTVQPSGKISITVQNVSKDNTGRWKRGGRYGRKGVNFKGTQWGDAIE